MRGLATAFVAESAIIAWRNLHNDKALPPPSQFTGAAIVFGLLGLIPEGGQRAATAIGWAFVLATFINLWNPATPLNLLTASSSGAPATNAATSQSFAPGRTGTGQQPAGPG